MKEAKVMNFTKPLRRRAVGLGLAALMGFNLVVSYLVLWGQSLRLDESQSLWQSSHSVTGIFKVVAQDVHVPLYHQILHFWMLAFGSSVTSVRSLSMVFFLALIPAGYLLAREVLSPRRALLATAFLSLSPFMGWYGSEARMYTLLALATIINQYFFLRIMKGRQGHNWIGYALSGLVGIYSHYFFMFNLITQAIFFLLQRRKFPHGSFVRFVGIATFLGAALSPWLIYVHSLGSASGTRPQLIRPTTTDFFNTFSQFVFGFQTNAVNTIVVSFWPLLILLGFLAIGKNKRFTPEVGFMLTAAIVPVVAAFIVSLTVTPVFVSRYMIIVLPALYIFVTWMLTNYPRRIAIVVVSGLVVALNFMSFQQDVSAATPVKENYQTVAADVSRLAGTSDEVVLSSPFTKYPFQYYYDGAANVRTLPEWERGPAPAYNAAAMEAQVQDLATDHQYAYVVLSYNQGYEQHIKLYFDKHYALVSSKSYSNDLTLRVYRLRYDAPVVAEARN